jgi:all-trans-8'-apo-beta-carotenal 15,15'-oxygenase
MTFPRDFLSGRGPLDLELVKEGTWPEDLHGTAYWSMPDTRGPGAGAIFAPGMLARVNLDAGRQSLRWSCSTVRTPDVRLRERTPELFRRLWIADMSPYGFSNAANTNPLPFKGRMLVAWDGGRPVEVDPKTGDYITLLGERRRWQEGAQYPLLPAIGATAHPVYDHERDLVYGVDYRSALGSSEPAALRIMTWDTRGAPFFHRVENSHLRQYVHEVGQTRDYLILGQGAFRLELTQAMNGKRSLPQSPDSPLWIVNKNDLRPGVTSVRATEVVVKRELNHLFGDWEDQGGVLTFFAQHTPGFDINCWIKPGDYSELTGEPVPESLIGMYAGATDVCPMARYHIDVKRGTISDAVLQGDPARHWTNNLYAKSYAPAHIKKHTHLFHLYSGHHPELVTEEVFHIYKHHPYRTVPAEDIPLLTIPGCLDLVDLTTMKQVGGYQFKAGEAFGSPLAIPKRNMQRQDQMWVLALRLDGPQTRLCVFDGEALERGPVASASHPDFKIGLPLHAAWMAEHCDRDTEYRVPFSADLGPGYARLPTEAKRAAEAVMRELG